MIVKKGSFHQYIVEFKVSAQISVQNTLEGYFKAIMGNLERCIDEDKLNIWQTFSSLFNGQCSEAFITVLSWNS